jgi:mevalonate kinase
LKSTSSAPAKVILFGEHFVVYGGKAILCSIDKRITVESELTDTGKIEISSDLGSLAVPKNVDIQDVGPVFRPLIYLAQQVIKSDSVVRISVKSEIPAGVGLGSSSACCVAAASSLLGLYSKPSKEEVLELAVKAERTVFENASGADTNICVYGGIIEYSKNKIKKLDLKPEFKLIIANSRVAHSTSEVVARVKKFKEKQGEAFSILCDNEATLIEEALQDLKVNDVRALGQKMLVNQAHLEKIGVSSKILDSMVDSVKDVAYGAKITGAGDGGCIIVLVDEKNIEKTLNVLHEKNYECFAADIDTTGTDNKK